MAITRILSRVEEMFSSHDDILFMLNHGYCSELFIEQWQKL